MYLLMYGICFIGLYNFPC